MSRPPRSPWIWLLVAVLCAGTAPATVTRSLPADSSVVAPAPPAAGSATSFMMGSLLLEQGDIQAALSYLAYAHAHDPDTPLVTRTYVEALLRAGDLESALPLARDLAARPGALFGDHQQLLRLELATGRLDAAAATLARIGSAWPDSAQVDLWRGELAARRGDIADAVDAFARFAQRRPDRKGLAVESLARLAVSLPGAPARRCWEKARELAPDDDALLMRMLEDLVRRRRVNAALALAQESDAAGRPRLSDGSWQGLAGMLAARAQAADSVLTRYLPRLRAGRLPPDACALVVRLLADREEWERAVAAGRTALAHWPEDPDLLELQARLLATRDRLDEAVASARRLAQARPRDLAAQTLLLSLLNELHPDVLGQLDAPPDSAARAEILPVARHAASLVDDGTEPRSVMLVAATLQGLGEHRASIPFYRRAARDSALARDAVLNIAVALEKTDRLDAAVSLLDSLEKARPDDPVVANALGYLLADHDRDLDRAERLIRRALAAEPDNPAYLDSLGWVLFRRGDWQGAFDRLVEAVNRRPDDPVILEHLARTLWEQGARERARAVLEQAIAAGGDRARLERLRRRWTDGER